MYVTTGFSLPYVAKRTGNATYTDGQKLARGVSVELEVESADNNNFYADNVIAESEAGRFTGGSLNLTVDGLSSAAAKLILGMTETVQVGSTPFDNYTDQLEPPYVGVGYVRRVMQDGVTSYFAVIHPKCKFNIPTDSAETSEDTINWQTTDLTANILRDDATGGWKYQAQTPAATEAAAEALIKTYLGIE